MVTIGNEYRKQGLGVVFINSNDPDVKGDTMDGMKACPGEPQGYVRRLGR